MDGQREFRYAPFTDRIMKKLLFSLALAFTATFANAGDDVIAFSSSTSVGVLRSGGNMYRPIPRGGGATDLTSTERYRATVYRPTQHFYLKDNVVSYRYASDSMQRMRTMYGGAYFGPNGAQFIPSEHQLAANASVKHYASVHKRAQPGVPMISRTKVRVTRTAETAPTTSIQLASAK
jgi:hypothetical protein